MTARLRGWYWWWRLELEGIGPGLRLHYRRHNEPLTAGVAYSGPERRLYQQCCSCGRFRIFGKFVEMYGPSLAHWRYECLDCALKAMTNRAVEGKGEVSDGE